MKVTPWTFNRARPTRLSNELQRIREFKKTYGLDRLAINVVEEHPKHPEPFWQVSLDDWCCHIHKEDGTTMLTLTTGGGGVWKGPVAISDLAGVVLGSLRTAVKLQERYDEAAQDAAIERDLAESD